MVDIQGAIITIDAMGAQKAIAAQIIDGEGDYVLALKGNQEALPQAVIDSIDERLEGELEGAQEHVTVETGHGREETRTDLPLPAPKGLPGFGLWKAISSHRQSRWYEEGPLKGPSIEALLALVSILVEVLSLTEGPLAPGVLSS
ncbi:MAG: ISAs1 family transposase, partial [Singulisphaera sp.]|nr:ISAs1 family transposase [Singulisphaera sp.]